MTDLNGYNLLNASETGVALNGHALPSELHVRRPASSSLRGQDRETGGQFTLGQNYPNPYEGETTVPFSLTNPADVRLSLFDMAGRKVAGVTRKGMKPGRRAINLNLTGLGLPAGDYVYQLQVTNHLGVFRQCKMMTSA